VFWVSEIEEKLERIEQNERKLEALYTRVDTLEVLNSRDRPGNSDSDVVRIEEPGETINSQEQQVNIILGSELYLGVVCHYVMFLQ
jgi:hypothetical protein